MFITLFVTSAGAGLFCSLWLFFSWWNYLDLEQELVQLKTYEAEIKIYIEKGVAEFGKVDTDTLVTDLKYHSYQRELSDKLYRMRLKVNSYNDNLIGKKILIRNVLVGNILTVLPRDMDMYDMAATFNIPMVRMIIQH
jgi:hypothetical protein